MKHYVFLIFLVKEKAASLSTAAAKTVSSSIDSAAAATPPLPSLSPPPSAKPAPAPAKAAPTPSVAQKAAPAAAATPQSSSPRPAADVQISAPAKPLPTNLTDLQKSLEVAAHTAAKEYSNAIQVLSRYSEDVKNVVDKIIETSDNTVWGTLKNKTSARDTAVDTAEKAAQQARATIGTLLISLIWWFIIINNHLFFIEKLETHVGNVAKDVSPEVLDSIKRNIKLISEQLNKTKDELYNAKDAANLSERYWKKVEEARNYFVDQVEALFPGVDLGAKKLNLSKDDVDLFILHAYSHVLAYQKELQKIHVEGETRLRRAVEALKGDDQSEAVKRQLEYHLEKEKQLLNIDNQKKIFKIQAESENKLRGQLKRQAEAHSDHLTDALGEKEKELRRIFNRELNEKLSVEQASYKLQLATIIGKLKGMDVALKGTCQF